MINPNELFTSAVISGVVVAALITSLTNLIVSVINNRRLKVMEKRKNASEIDKYRYTRLYEMLFNWHNYDSEIKGESAEEIAFYRVFNEFFDNINRYDIIRPLLDEQFIIELDEYKEKGNNLLKDWIEFYKSDRLHTDDFLNIKTEYLENGVTFSKKLQDVINQQLKMLLMK